MPDQIDSDALAKMRAEGYPMHLWQQALDQIYGERLLMTCNCIQSNFLNPWGFVILVHCHLLPAAACCCQCPLLPVPAAATVLCCHLLPRPPAAR